MGDKIQEVVGGGQGRSDEEVYFGAKRTLWGVAVWVTICILILITSWIISKIRINL